LEHEWGEENRICYWWESQKKLDHWEDHDVDGWIIHITMDLGEIGCGGLE
jgi:hypothetical protein